jgi:TPP-dependent pyruvate/acetoin dehydrogenase alpha subunit
MLKPEQLKAMLRQMVLIRAFEEKLDELYQRKAMFGSTHSIVARRRSRSGSVRHCTPAT